MMLRLLGGNFTKARSHLFVTSSFSMLGHSSIHGPGVCVASNERTRRRQFACSSVSCNMTPTGFKPRACGPSYSGCANLRNYKEATALFPSTSEDATLHRVLA